MMLFVQILTGASKIILLLISVWDFYLRPKRPACSSRLDDMVSAHFLAKQITGLKLKSPESDCQFKNGSLFVIKEHDK